MSKQRAVSKQIVIIRTDSKEVESLCELILGRTKRFGVWDLDELKQARYSLKRLPKASAVFKKWLK